MSAKFLTTILILTLALSASAATLETSAQVMIVPMTTVELAAPATSDLATWNLEGNPGDQVQVSLELRTLDGQRLDLGQANPLTFDDTGQAIATLPTPTNHDTTTPVLTLVLNRE